MKTQTISLLKYWAILPAIIFMLSCNYDQPQLTPHQIRHTQRQVTKFTADIARNVSAKGPIAWVNYFDNSPNFFMANNGQLAFHDHASAQKFIQDTLVKNITKITLRWANMRIDPLTTSIVAIGSNFHEDITIGNTAPMPVDGYFTATALLTPTGWKLRNAHWSVKSK